MARSPKKLGKPPVNIEVQRRAAYPEAARLVVPGTVDMGNAQRNPEEWAASPSAVLRA